MVMLEANGEKTIHIRTSRQSVFDLVRDVQAVGKYWPGVDGIEDLGDGKFRWTLATRKTLGTSFTPQYINQYNDNGKDEVFFETVEGNVKSSGSWRIADHGSSVSLSLRVTSEVDVPIPRLLKKPATLFASREVTQGIQQQLHKIKRQLEAR